VAVPAILGAGIGAALAGGWLIPGFPPGAVFMGLALLVTAAGTVEMGLAADPMGEETMSERVVIVTGVGDRGQVGYAVAEAFVSAGARVVVTSRGDGIQRRAGELGESVVGVAADLTDPAGAESVVAAARDRWGRLDVLVNVAGGLHVTKSVSSTSPDEWQREVDSNVRTAFLMSRAALPLLRESSGAIVNFASPAGLRAVGGMAAYSAGKAGVVALTRSLAREERDRGVRVNAIAPGMIDTMQNRESVPDADAVRWVTRDEIVDVVRFLAGDQGRGVNGETIRVMGPGL
jgi:NAD(P)-dependent dehydrogenase (short-subunit alcohol dehydrogenase family)